jgi:transposase
LKSIIPRNRRSTDWQTDDDTPLDPGLCHRRLAIERLNAWLNGFKTLLLRYETSLQNWLAFHWLAFTASLLHKVANLPTS